MKCLETVCGIMKLDKFMLQVHLPTIKKKDLILDFLKVGKLNL